MKASFILLNGIILFLIYESIYFAVLYKKKTIQFKKLFVINSLVFFYIKLLIITAINMSIAINMYLLFIKV